GNSTLTIVNVTRYNEGSFSCNVFNPISNGTSQPLTPPSAVSPFPLTNCMHLYVLSNDLLCLALEWMKDGEHLSAVHFGDGNSTLTIVNVTRYNEGSFSCNVFNPISNGTSQPLTLTINNPQVYSTDVLYGSGSDLTLSCSAEYSPPAQFQWAMNTTLLSNMGPKLRLENIQASQSGSYSCWAHNTRTLRWATSELGCWVSGPCTVSFL
uniref:Ig-like domain-containing protein n=1 Tax=Hucho hucho TaxID=62062 RepID=A0A4W5M076_9TELE